MQRERSTALHAHALRPPVLLRRAFAGGAAAARSRRSIDYDPRRATELRACDEHRYHGRVEQARACYSQLAQLVEP